MLNSVLALLVADLFGSLLRTINLVEEHTLALTPPVTAIKAKSKARLRDDNDDDDAGITEKPVASASRKRRKSSVAKAPAKALSKSTGKNAKAAAAAEKAAVDSEPSLLELGPQPSGKKGMSGVFGRLT